MRASRPLKSLGLALSLPLFLNACATGSGSSGAAGGSDGRREIVGLEEMSLEYIQTLWGAPDQNIPAGKGRTVRFKDIRTENEDPITGAIAVKYCDVRLDVNERQLVQTWVYETCRATK